MIGMETLNQLKFTRSYTLGRLKNSVDTAWDTQPKGFNNTICWNAGHVFVTMETLIKAAVDTYEIAHPEWVPLFKKGSSPANWERNIPSKDEILTALKEQPERAMEALKGSLSNSLNEPISIGPMHTMETVEAVVQFILWHEGVHAGIINSMNIVVGK